MRLIACLISRNEERNLERCLSSLSGAVDGICLVDTGSSDRTIEIAKSFGAVVGQLPWDDDFSAPRNACLELADGDWALQVDADEELDRSTIPALRAALSEAAPCRLVEVELQDGTDRPGSVVLPRLFRLDRRIRYRRALHESVLESLEESGLGEPAHCRVRLIHHGYRAEAIASRSKHERNVRILRRVRDRGLADAYDLYKLGTTLSAWDPAATDRSAALAEAWSRALEAAPAERSRWPWLPTLARARALDLASGGRLQPAWEALESLPEVHRHLPVGAARVELLFRSGRPREALDLALAALGAPQDPSLSATTGKERGDLLHLAARCARRTGGQFLHLLEESAATGNLEARCDLILRGIEAGVPSAWKDLDVLLRTHSGHPTALLAASEASRSQGDRSTSDLLLQQAARIHSEAAMRARGRLWMRAWLGGATPPFELPPTDVENAAATALDRILRDLPWAPDPFLHPPALKRALGEILQALLDAGRDELVRTFARNAAGRDHELEGISSLVVEG